MNILAECAICGNVLKIQRSGITKTGTGFDIKYKYFCPCGKEWSSIEGNPSSNNMPTTNNQLKCPKCKSTNLTANTKGFGLGKAAVGGILLGPVGLLGGLLGSKKPVFICLNCGNQFEKQ